MYGEESEVGCYHCGKTMKAKDAEAHLSEKHPGLQALSFYNVYRCRETCSACGASHDYIVPPGMGPDWVSRDEWHACPNKPPEAKPTFFARWLGR